MNHNDLMTKTLRIGLVTLSAFLLTVIAFYSISNNLPVFTHSSERKLPIYCVQSDKPKISISFDAAWGNEDTGQILEILKKYNVKATFFMTGGWIDNYPEDVKAIAKAGHDVANHSQNHKQMSQLTATQCEEEIMMVKNKIKKLTKQDSFLFRPPYGDYNNTLIETVEACDCYCIQWDVDSLDWKNYGIDTLISTVLEHKALGNGSIILMHNGAKYTKDALPSIIEGLQKKGYELVPVSQLIYRENYEIDHAGRQIPTGTPSPENTQKSDKTLTD